MLFIFAIASIIISIYVFYCVFARFLKIKDLGEDVIGLEEKEKYLKTVKINMLITSVCILCCCLTLLSPTLEIKLCILISSLLINGYVYSNLQEEIEEFDISKKDSDIVSEFLNKRSVEAKANAETNKIKSIELDQLEKIIEEKEKNSEITKDNNNTDEE